MAGLSTNAPGLWGGFAGLLYGSTSLSTPPGFLADATPAWVPAGGVLAFEFDNGLGYNSRNLATTTPDSILTYTSPSPKLVYGSDGVLRYAPHNLLTYSQEFDQGAWPKSNVTVTANAAVAPDGTTTADLVYPTTTGNSRRILRDIVSLTTGGVTYTQSLYVKSAGFRWLRTTAVNSASPADNIWFDIIDGVVGTVGGGVVAYSISPAGNGWFRITATGIADDVNDYFWIACVDSDGSDTSTTNGTSGLYIWGAQLQRTPNHSNTYIPTTTAAVYSLPIDHNPTTFAPLGVLIEEGRINLLLQSANFSTTWNTGGNSVTADQIAAPDGTTTADMITMIASSAVFQSVTVVASTAYVFSFWVKRGAKTNLQYRIYDNSNATNIVAATSYYSQTSSSVWTRVTFAFTTPVGCISARCYVDDSSDGSSGTFYVWGAQLEAGAFPTSYVPTVASQVTRLADQVSILTSAFGYNAAAGTSVFAGDVSAVNLSSQRVLQTGGSGRLIYIGGNQISIFDGTTVVPAIGGIVVNTAFKAATAYGVADGMGVSFNAGTVATGAFDGGMTSGTLYLGSDNAVAGFLNGHIKRLTYFPTRRTNADLQVLST